MVTIIILILLGLAVFGPMVLADADARNQRRELHNNPETHNQWCRENNVAQKPDLPDYQDPGPGAS
jgi:hypothetical protein